jgi:uncharacterized lipoprotein YmbA
MRRAFQTTTILAGLTGLLIGCTTTPSEFYMLDPLEPVDPRALERIEGPSLGVGPIRFPDYLDRPQIVTRPAPNRVELNEFQRWAGSLQGNFQRVMARNLAALLRSENVAEYPWDEPFDPDYRLLVDVYRFDGDLGGEVRLEARWSLTGRDRLRVLRGGQASIREPVRGKDYHSLIRAESMALAALSQQVAAAFTELGRNQAPAGTEASSPPRRMR